MMEFQQLQLNFSKCKSSSNRSLKRLQAVSCLNVTPRELASHASPMEDSRILIHSPSTSELPRINWQLLLQGAFQQYQCLYPSFSFVTCADPWGGSIAHREGPFFNVQSRSAALQENMSACNCLHAKRGRCEAASYGEMNGQRCLRMVEEFYALHSFKSQSLFDPEPSVNCRLLQRTFFNLTPSQPLIHIPQELKSLSPFAHKGASADGRTVDDDINIAQSLEDAPMEREWWLKCSNI